MELSVFVLTVLVGVAVLRSAEAKLGQPANPLFKFLGGAPRSDHWGANLTTPELIAAFGYPVEVHHVTTDDGYILEMHRIPHGQDGPTGPRPVAFLQHCLLCSSADFVMNYPHKALAYMLSDAGYDVWLNNFRGNTYCHSHVELDPSNVDFWNFNWDDHAFYDVPAGIDYALSVTGQEAVYYAGWSMGTTAFWALMSERPEYNDKIKAMAAMAPVAYMDHAKGPLIELAPFSENFDVVLTLLGVGELLPSSALIDYTVETYCDQEAVTAEICYNFLFLLAGPDADEVPKETLPAILAHTPAGTSVHTVNHYAQTVMTGTFAKYDYGLLGNLNHYGQNEPPLYNLQNVTAPVALFWGNTDWLAAPEDVARLAAELPNVALNHNVDKEEFNHLDFGWSEHADQYVYRYILDFFASH